MAVDLVVPPDGVVTTPGTGEIGPGVQTAPDAIVDGLPRDGLATAPDILGVPEGVIPVPDPIGPVPPTPVTPTPVTPGLTPAVQAGVGVAAGLAGLALLAAPLALIGLNKKPKPLVIAGDIRHTGTTHFLGTPRTRKPVHLGVGKHANNRRNSNLRKKSILITKKVKILPPSLNRVVKSVPPLIKTVRQWTISTYPTLARINQCNKRLSPPSSPAESL